MVKTVNESTIISNIFWKFLKGFLTFMSVILIFRNINISDYGWYITTISVFELAAILSLPGVMKIALRSALLNDKRFSNLLGLKLLFLPLLLLGFFYVPDWIAVPILIAVIADQIAMFAKIRLNEQKKYLSFNLFECLKPFLLILGVSVYIIIYKDKISLNFLVWLYCFSSVLASFLNILYSKKFASFSLKISMPTKIDLSQSFYASGNGLIGIFIKRGSILFTAIILSSAEVAYMNIMVQIWSIFAVVFTGVSLSLTRDIYDNSSSYKVLKNTYFRPLVVLILTISMSSIVLNIWGGFFLNLIFGEESLGARDIIHFSPLILLFQLPQLILMSAFMRQKKEKLILILNCISILIFSIILYLFAFNLLSLVKILLCFTIFASFIYFLAFLKPNIFKHI
jgi:O-antigen/teichoic acid export membrane protein